MKEKKKRYERSYEEIIAMIPKKFVKAKTLDEAQERAYAQVKKFNSSSDDLNAIWNLFKAAPEIFLFDEYVNRIREQYRSSHIYMHNNADIQLRHLESTLYRLQGVSREYYANLLQQEASTSNGENKNEKEEESMKGTKEAKKTLTSKIKKSLVGDKTDISEFMHGCDETKALIVLTYLQQRGVTTLDDFLALNESAKSINSYRVFISHNKLQDVNETLIKNIVEWATNDDKTATSKTSEDTVQETAKQEAPVQKAPVMDNVVQDASVQDTPAETAGQKIEVSDEEFFEYLKTLPASHFVKGSKEMEIIAERYREYLDNLTKSFVDECFVEEDLKEVIDEADKKYRPIVDAKREQYERELKREAVAAYTRKLIDESVKYHHDPRMFDQQPKHEGHKHFQDNGREL